MFKVMSNCMLTTIQDPLGRRGHQGIGLPSSGAMDSLALTVGNILVGNEPDEAGIEFAFMPPSLLFMDDCLVALTGAPAQMFIDGNEVPMWQAVLVRKGQTLTIKMVENLGQWGYISISGGIDVPEFMGSKSTFSFCGIGGFEGRMLKNGDCIPTGKGSLKNEGKKLRGRYIPVLTDPMIVELMEGYYLDYLSDEDIEKMFSSVWTVQTNSNRMGYRLSGPTFDYSEKAKNKDASAGSDPSNIFDTGYPLYAINLCGDTPIIIAPESVVCGGYFCPFSIPVGAQWKIGQCRIGSRLQFKYTTKEEADALRNKYDLYLQPECYTF